MVEISFKKVETSKDGRLQLRVCQGSARVPGEGQGPLRNEALSFAAPPEVSVVGRTAFMVAAERALEADRGEDA